MKNVSKRTTGKSEKLNELLERNTALEMLVDELGKDLSQAKQQRHAAEQRLIKTRASLTYQLGYRLKAGAGSLSGILRLPWDLFDLYRQARSRRMQDQHIACNAGSSAKPPPPRLSINCVPPPPRPSRLEDYESVRSRFIRSADQPQTALKIACIMDDFTYSSYRYECNLQQLTPLGWKAELHAFQPQLLFVESAWCGQQGLWSGKIGHNSHELKEMLAWCRRHGVATVFWSKEDPVHFETFLTTASQFDQVFTVDIDCIQRYKGALGHDRVYLLPFACQPALHNPIELYDRKDAFCFAGAYYARYPERTRDLDNLLEQLSALRPLEIFDRNFDKSDVNYQFPTQYQAHIVGTLRFDEIDTAYKGYRYALNLNSVKQSQSMFARRVFELLGCNTLTVSNYARGLRLLFGDLVIATDNGEEMLRRLDYFSNDEHAVARVRLAALRKVMQEHTYSRRLAYVMSKVTGAALADDLPHIGIFAHASSHSELLALVGHFQRQCYASVQMHIVILDTLTEFPAIADPRVHLVTAADLSLHALADGATWLAGMVAQDYYGPNYLLDLALATRYSNARVLGKGAFYENRASGIQLQNPQLVYRPVARLAARSALVHVELARGQVVGDWVLALPEQEFEHDKALAIDSFNYCRNAGAINVEQLNAWDDECVLGMGIGIEQLQARAEAIAPLVDECSVPELSGQKLAELFGPLHSRSIAASVDGNTWHISSALAEGKHEYLYSAQELDVDRFNKGEPIKLHLEVTPGLNVQLVILFLDANKQRISHAMQRSNCNLSADIPPEAAFIRLGLRIYSSGSATIKALLLGHCHSQPLDILGSARHLLVTNHYPAYDDLYRNGFVHTRVSAYQKRGLSIDVFRLRNNESVHYHEFANTDVVTGPQSALATMLENGAYESILVHFLDQDMWEVLSRYLAHTRVIVWLHGADIQPWWRREHNYSTHEQLQLAKLQSEKRLGFWRKILRPMPDNLKLIFVSRYFADEVMEDLGFCLPEDQYEIIHNPIDTALFSWQKKPVEQRMKVLSIRPYASAKYANDLSVKAIKLLAHKPYFKKLEFRMIGDGVLFEETVAPLRKYPNVKIEKGFLTHAQIAALHKEYGLFLCPTRDDTHGVSRDEAMASGLVPITNSVTAIPEFVDDHCGILAPGEDAQSMASGMARIFENPQLFSNMSVAARQRVERQTAASMIIERELAVITEAFSKADSGRSSEPVQHEYLAGTARCYPAEEVEQ